MGTLLWTFPTLVAAAIIIGWAAEITAVHLSAGIALAVLAWLQTAPEFAVEAVIAWSRQTSLVLANLTGSLRLLMGLGWPMICFIHYLTSRKNKKNTHDITLPLNFSIEATGLVIPVFYFSYIALKGRWNVIDGIILCFFYGIYFSLLYRQRKKGLSAIEEEGDSPVVNKILSLSHFWQKKAALGMFVLGGVTLFFCVPPFIEALKSMARSVGISEFIFIQWIAPIASEFPEKVTAFNWARHTRKVPMAIVNMLSSMISQWTLLAGLIPIIFSISSGQWTTIELSDFQRVEIMLTVVQSGLAVLFLSDLKITFIEATGLFVLWFIQFIFPSSRLILIWVYSAWILVEFIRLLLKPSRCIAWKQMWKIIFYSADIS